MSAPVPRPVGASARRTPRWRYALQAGVLLFTLSACCVLAIVLGAQTSRRLDVTSTRQHVLSPETRAIIESLRVPVTLLIAADESKLRPTARQRLLDVIDTVRRASPRVSLERIDTGAPDARPRLAALLGRLADEDRPLIDRHVATIRAAGETAQRLADELDALSTPITTLGQEVARGIGPPGTRAADEWTSVTANWVSVQRTIAADLRAASRDATALLSATSDLVPAPPVHEAATKFRKPLDDLSRWLVGLGNELENIGAGAGRASEVRPEQREVARTLARGLGPMRDRAARQLLDLSELPKARVLLVGEQVQRQAVAFAIGPAGSADSTGRAAVVDVNLDELLGPASTGVSPEVADRRFRVEELLAAGLANFVDRARPVVVFTHFLPRRIGPEFRPIRMVVERLALRGVEFGEWAVALDSEEPKAVSAARTQGRPVVYVTLVADPVDFEVLLGERGRIEYATARGKMASAMRTIVDSGRSMLVSVNPSRTSTLTNNIADPLVDMLEPMVVFVDSGRVLVRQVRTQTGEDVATHVEMIEPGAEHAISASVSGQVLRLPWCVPITLREVSGESGTGSGASAAPRRQVVLAVPASPDLWAESEWSSVRDRGVTLPGQRTSAVKRSNPNNNVGTNEPWVVALAIERARADGPSQRLVVVGSNLWFGDTLTRQEVQADGRIAPAFPGNAELFQACVSWLAGQEDLIARSPAAQAVATIPSLSLEQLRVLWWVLVVGLPVSVLVLGAAWRSVRG
jgi:hypothetical protein